MRYKSAIVLSAAALAAGLVGAVPVSATAEIGNLQITQVGYNANGADSVWNRNKEYVDIRQQGPDAADVKGLVVADSWAKNHADDNPGNCNTYTVSSVPDVAEVDGKILLPVGHTLRVYNGYGTPKTSGTFHLVYANSKCGYHGHIYNNGGDTVWLTKGGDSESFTYNFDNGYYVR
jgi:hypothetical protein